MTQCKSCGAPIQFGITVKGKRIPLDAEGTLLTAKPNIHIVGLFANGTPAVDITPPGAEGATHTTHFATCPNTAKHRRPR